MRKRRKRRPRRRWPPIKPRAEPRAVTGAARRAASRNAHSSTTTSSERNLEAAILREIEAFILELGTGFAFLERQKRRTVPGEEALIGLMLCASLRHETVEWPDLEKSGNRVSSDWTEVLPKEQLQRKLREAVRLARARLAEKPEAKKSSTKRKKLR